VALCGIMWHRYYNVAFQQTEYKGKMWCPVLWLSRSWCLLRQSGKSLCVHFHIANGFWPLYNTSDSICPNWFSRWHPKAHGMLSDKSNDQFVASFNNKVKMQQIPLMPRARQIGQHAALRVEPPFKEKVHPIEDTVLFRNSIKEDPPELTITPRTDSDPPEPKDDRRKTGQPATKEPTTWCSSNRQQSSKTQETITNLSSPA
jgi:hypothetical protein